MITPSPTRLMTKSILLVISAIFTVCFNSFGVNYDKLRFGNEAADTVRINEMLIRGHAMDFRTPGECVEWVASQFIGTPYVAGTLEGEAPDYAEVLTVDLDHLDCTTFVDVALAMAYTIGERRTSWRDFVYNLERFRYRGGHMGGYGSRLHYFSDWVIDNVHRGNVTDATTLFPAVHYQVKTLDFMSSNRSKYPAMTPDANYEGIKNAEIGYRNHRFPYIKAQNVGAKPVRQAFRSGDVVAFLTKTPGLDVAHLGIIVVKEGVPYLLHASSSAGKVVLNETPLEEVFRKNRSYSGLRVIRLHEW